jgi:hypothetical protein
MLRAGVQIYSAGTRHPAGQLHHDILYNQMGSAFTVNLGQF